MGVISDALGVANFHVWGCNDYMPAAVDSGPEMVSGKGTGTAAGQGDAVGCAGYLALVMPRDRRDHIVGWSRGNGTKKLWMKWKKKHWRVS